MPKLQLKKEFQATRRKNSEYASALWYIIWWEIGRRNTRFGKERQNQSHCGFPWFFSLGGGGREIIAYFAWLLRVFKWCKKKCRHYSTCPRYRGGTMPFLTRASSHSVPGRVGYDKSTWCPSYSTAQSADRARFQRPIHRSGSNHGKPIQ